MNKKYLITSICCVLLAVGGAYWAIRPSKRVMFIQNDLIFNEFKGKRDFESLLLKEQGKKKSILDSLAIEINLLKSRNTGSDPKMSAMIQDRESLYMRVKDEFIKSNNESYTKYMDEIWKQLNGYIQEYGKEKGYQYILGAQGSGVIMYAEEENNISKEVIEYSNKKYEGK
jgi:outer membrane protein